MCYSNCEYENRDGECTRKWSKNPRVLEMCPHEEAELEDEVDDDDIDEW